MRMLKGWVLCVFLFAVYTATPQGLQVSCSPATQEVMPDSTISFDVMLIPYNGFSQQVALKATSNILPQLNISFSQQYVFYPYDTALTMNVSVNGSVTSGHYWIAVSALNGPIISTDTVYINIDTALCGWHQIKNPADYGANYIGHIVFDSSGNVWAGGTNVEKFDGTNWTVYSNANSALPSPVVNDLCIDASNHLWVATGGGLAIYDGVYWTVYDSANSGLTTNNITSVTVDSAGVAWIGTKAGIFSKNGDSWTVYNSQNSGISNDNIKKIRIYKSNRIYALSVVSSLEARIDLFDGSNWKEMGDIKNCYPDIGDFDVDTNGNLWMTGICCVHYGLLKYDGVGFVQWLYSQSPNNHEVKNLTCGINEADSASQLPDYDAYRIYIDDKNRVWASMHLLSDSYYGDGIVVFDGTNWTHLTRENSPLPKDNILAIGEKNGKTWISYPNSNYLGVQDYCYLSYSTCNFFTNETATGIKNIGDYNFEFYPNPVSDLLNVKFTQTIKAGAQFIIYDIAGRRTGSEILKVEAGAGNPVQLSLKNLSPGIYFVSFINNNQSATFKVVKE